ncbi:MAG TPA: cysteine desulfurase-like protein [Gemmatimonadaceae bacterium]|nr:cysteine desulfurase-like protein [Gemmatimonadaceae bacterium]
MTAAVKPHVASIDAIRAQFPALARVQGKHPVAYFDGPGGTQVPRLVADAMSDYLFHHNANTHWSYPTSEETDAMIAASRAALADFLGAAPNEIAFGQNMTTITFHLARAIGRALGPGDEIVITELDHHANVAPWRALERERGVTVRSVRLDAGRGVLDWGDLERQLGTRTRVLAIGAASNGIGTVTDVAAATKLARAAAPNALVFVDAVHYAPHHLVDVRAIDCDFLACSAYKFYGPHIGVLYGKHERLAALDVPKLAPAPNEAPERMETGTQNHEGIVGAGAAVTFLESLAPDAGAHRRARLAAAMHELHQRGEVLFRRLWDGLGAMKKVRRFGVPAGAARTPTAVFVVDGVTTERVARSLAAAGVYVSNGDFYATTVVERLGQSHDGLVRAGCSCYSTMDEVERLLAGVAAVAR